MLKKQDEYEVIQTLINNNKINIIKESDYTQSDLVLGSGWQAKIYKGNYLDLTVAIKVIRQYNLGLN